MHLSEGIINSPWILGGGAALACGGVAIGLRRLDETHALRTAVLGSGFFVASLVHIPVLGTSVHLSLGGLLGIVLGWAAFPAVLVALILQAALFGFGGMTTLGLNTCIMAIPAVLVYYLSRLFSRVGVTRHTPWVCGILGALAVVLSSLLLAAIVRMGGDDAFLIAAASVLIAHVPVMLIEAGVTAAAVKFLLRVSPELLSGTGLVSDHEELGEEASCE